MMNPATHSLPALLGGALALLAAACTDSRTPSPDPALPSGQPVVQTTNYPITYFAQRIAGPQVEIVFQAPPDEDPAFWQPSAEQIAAYQTASLVLLNGATYEKWLDKVSLPASLLVDTSASFSSGFIEIKDAATHSHGKEGVHSHSGTAFTTWIDLDQARQQAETVRAALVRLVPDAAASMNQNAAALADGLDQLDASLQAAAHAIGNQPIVASHPIYQYFARRYALQIEPLLWEPDIVPDAAALDDLKKLLTRHPAKWMLWEGDPAPESVEKLQAMGVQSVVFDPCGNRPETGDWLSVMRQNVENLRAMY